MNDVFTQHVTHSVLNKQSKVDALFMALHYQ